MNKFEAVKKMQDYIDNNINDVITMKDLSIVSYYSPWYSYRIFQELINMTPSDYIRRLRLSKSAIELRDNFSKVIDVAYKYGYESVDGYQRAFYKEFGINPYEYAKNPVPITLFINYKVIDTSKTFNKGDKQMKEVSNVFVTVITKPQRKVIIKRGIKAEEYFEYCGEVGCDTWGILKSMKSLCGEPVCLWLPKKYIKENTSKYVQGVEVASDYDGVIPEGFDVIALPESKYIMFQGEKFKEEDFEEAIGNLWEAIKKYDPSIIGYKFTDELPRIQLEPIGERGYIELLPVEEAD